jgi:hypothetical protein
LEAKLVIVDSRHRGFKKSPDGTWCRAETQASRKQNIPQNFLRNHPRNAFTLSETVSNPNK